MIRAEFSSSKNALNLGALAGLVISVIQYVANISGNSTSAVASWSIYILLILSISWGTRKQRELNEGYMSFSQVLGFGTLLSLGAALVIAFFTYVYANFVDTGFIPDMLEQMEIALYESGYDDETAESLMEMYNQFLGPGIYAFSVLFTYIFMGFLASLVISFFVRRDRPMFEE